MSPYTVSRDVQCGVATAGNHHQRCERCRPDKRVDDVSIPPCLRGHLLSLVRRLTHGPVLVFVAASLVVRLNPHRRHVLLVLFVAKPTSGDAS